MKQNVSVDERNRYNAHQRHFFHSASANNMHTTVSDYTENYLSERRLVDFTNLQIMAL